MPYHTAMREVPANAEQLFTLYDPKTCRVITENDEWTPCLADGCYESRPDADQFERISDKYPDLRVLSLHELMQEKLSGLTELAEKFNQQRKFGQLDLILGLPQVKYATEPRPRCLHCMRELTISSIRVNTFDVKLHSEWYTWHISWVRQIIFNAKAWSTLSVTNKYTNFWCGHHKGTVLVTDDCLQSYAVEAYKSGFVSPTKKRVEMNGLQKKIRRKSHPLYTRIEKERS